ncbi:deleted in malignant brain tumors 1 protein-like [Solea senegalensis]|uniref:Deleted in malignant brain tumors 1 protein-like n=1 Tax=Solea senegalensis TaxID=28829 RepID=A0AAV6SUJ5_SOLSE|nr:uncharacterized protein si:ch211-150o23.3 [Solea senegalensis]KAG7520474.1 deleted in malignant brain tumors 1 protein-like [Solea senegalensis]
MMLTFLRVLFTGLLGVLWDGAHAFGGIRLVDGENKCSGRVEVLHRDEWGTVCDHGWDLRDADVVCLQLGCGLAETAFNGAAFGVGKGEIWLHHVQCTGQESSLTRCAIALHSNSYCTHENDAGVKCSGTLLRPSLTLLSPHTEFSPGETVRFGCSVLLGHHFSDFHLYKHGVSTPLVTQRAEQSQTSVELTLPDIEIFHQGSYSCRYRIKGRFPFQLLSSPPSNSINITLGALLTPILTLLSPHTVFSPGEAVRFGCSVQLGHHLSDFHLYKHGVSTPLVTQRADHTQSRVELTLSDVETFHQGSYNCRYRIKGGFSSELLSSPPSNSINITVVELLTPQHWYNTSSDAPAGSVMKGHGFNITCSTQQQYPGGSFQLRLIQPNGTVRQSLPALTPSVTFTFPNAQSSNEGYYYCLYRVQMGGRTFVSRESQPLPIAIRDPDPLLSPMVISWLVSGLTFVVAVIVIIIVAKVLCNKEKNPSELERETRTCVDNTYVALSINKL